MNLLRDFHRTNTNLNRRRRGLRLHAVAGTTVEDLMQPPYSGDTTRQQPKAVVLLAGGLPNRPNPRSHLHGLAQVWRLHGEFDELTLA